VEAVCSRAIIIDHGQVVANGTPRDLKRRSANAGAVLLRLSQAGVQAPAPAALVAKVGALPGVENAALVGPAPLTILAKACKDGTPKSADGDLARAIADLAAREAWKIEELHTEEGRLDEVFRSITLGDQAVSSATNVTQTREVA